MCGSDPAGGVTHRSSVVVSRVQVVNQDRFSEDVFKNCKGNEQGAIRAANLNILNFLQLILMEIFHNHKKRRIKAYLSS